MGKDVSVLSLASIEHSKLVGKSDASSSIEVREDDRPILEAIQKALKCGTIYHLRYARYAKWRAHVKLKVSAIREISQNVIPFFERHPLQAKKRHSFKIFKRIVQMVERKDHLTPHGIDRIDQMRQEMNT